MTLILTKYIHLIKVNKLPNYSENSKISYNSRFLNVNRASLIIHINYKVIDNEIYTSFTNIVDIRSV